jgi:hypothetical protein
LLVLVLDTTPHVDPAVLPFLPLLDSANSRSCSISAIIPAPRGEDGGEEVRSRDPDDVLSNELDILRLRRSPKPAKTIDGLTSPGAYDGDVLGNDGYGGVGTMGGGDFILDFEGVVCEWVDEVEAVRSCLEKECGKGVGIIGTIVAVEPSDEAEHILASMSAPRLSKDEAADVVALSIPCGGLIASAIGLTLDPDPDPDPDPIFLLPLSLPLLPSLPLAVPLLLRLELEPTLSSRSRSRPLIRPPAYTLPMPPSRASFGSGERLPHIGDELE